VARSDDLLRAALNALDPKPADTEPQATKRRYSELMSDAIAPAVAEELRLRGMKEARPALPGSLGASGAERRMSGGLGAKLVDCTWATEESGLLLAVSIKTINFRDARTKNFQKNLVNRRTDLLLEAVTMHRRFPYASMVGMLFLDEDAATDHTARRRSTFVNAHARMRIFTARDDPTGRDEQYERLYIALVDANPFASSCQFYEVGDHENPVPFDVIFDRMVIEVADRNPDFYEIEPGASPLSLRKVPG
jgi:hypothetical protein